jgi:hypothetical protein
MIKIAKGQKRPNKACTGRLGLCAFFGAGSELWQFSVFEPVSPQPPVTQAVGRRHAYKEDSMKTFFTALPQFEIIRVEKIGSVLKIAGVIKNVGSISRLKPGSIVTIVAPENQFIVGRFSEIIVEKFQASIEFSDPKFQDYFVGGTEYPLLDAYWGELATLVLDNSIIWKRVKFEPKDSILYHPDGRVENVKGGWDHEHCRICFQNISLFEAENQFGYVNQKDDWLCESCYQKYAANKSLGFINLDQMF